MTKTRQLLIPNPLQRSTVNKEILIDWLGEVPEDAEIGIDVGQFGQLDLVAFLEGGETDMWILALDSIPLPADKAITEANRERMMDQLHEIGAQDSGREHGSIIVTMEGVVAGATNLFSKNFRDAVTFKDTEQAKAFIDEFFDVIRHAVILDC